MKKIIRWFVTIAILLAILFFALIGRVDDSPLEETQFYQNTFKALNNFHPTNYFPKSKLKAGWRAINITPKSKMPMAGYAPRDHFDSVHDSIFVRILGIDNGSIQTYFISADLLLFPPALRNKLVKLKPKNRFYYFTATHSHSSIGGWDDSIVGEFIAGSFNESWLDSLAKKIDTGVETIAKEMRPSSINYFETDAEEFTENRIDAENGKVDGKVRGLKIIREDGSKGLLVSYSAHPTNISHLSLQLSGDYPNALVKKAEEKEYNFAMFAAGMIGSHRVKGLTEKEFALCDTLANKLFAKINSANGTQISDTIATGVVNVEYGPSQLHVLQNYKVRDWVFKKLFKPLKGDIEYLKIGNVIFLATPCDFSGEIFVMDELGKSAEAQGEKLFITSFNGDYIGYITYDTHYGHSEQEEVMAMNWVGPHYGGYYSKIIKEIIAKSKSGN